MIDENYRLYLPCPPKAMGAWRDRAECRGAPIDWFFPERGESCDQAKALCAKCEVQTECLDWAMTTPERYGIWGGVGERKRRPRRKLRAS